MKNTTQKRGRPYLEKPSSSTLPPIRVTPEEKEQFKDAAEKSGMSLSAWIKSIARENIAKS
ncbi:plasmid mobilization protein [Shewanella frigidimarina]|uniref:plasmid mobilization protein n=1 Tax=Shewanella frigidimarina TaxID=56812 RepID=UPI003FA074D1